MALVDEIRMAPVAASIMGFTVATSMQAFRDPALKASLLLHPWSVVRERKWYTMLTSSLVHADWLHLMMNMLTFYMFAFIMEGYLAYLGAVASGGTAGDWNQGGILGHFLFFLVYLVCQLVSDAVAVARYKDIPSYSSLGASGAIAGIISFFVMMGPPVSFWGFMPGWMFVLLYVGYSWYASKNARDNIGHDAHLWGALAGIAMAWILYPGECMSVIQRILSQWE